MKNKELESITGKAVFQAFPEETKRNILTLLQYGQTPEQIEKKMMEAINKRFINIPDWKREEIAGRYYLGAKYAKDNNLHLN